VGGIVDQVVVAGLTGRIVHCRSGIVKARIARREREPLAPVAMIVEFPVEALGAAEKRTGVLEPAAMRKELDGFETTPAGKPVSVTWTEPVKPLTELTDKLTVGLVPPCSTLMEFDEKPMEKSA
jgi:hypothetical protein